MSNEQARTEAATVEPGTIEVLEIRSRARQGLWRCKRRFTPEVTLLPVASLTEQEAAILRADPNLIVVVKTAAVPAPQSGGAPEGGPDQEPASTDHPPHPRADAGSTPGPNGDGEKAPDEGQPLTEDEQAALDKALRLAAIKVALLGLDETDAALFTKAGPAKLDVLSKLVGFPVIAAERDEAAAQLEAEDAAEAGAANPEAPAE